MSRRRPPHRLVIHTPERVTLKFWVSADVQIAANAIQYEREGRYREAVSAWAWCARGSHADQATKEYCERRLAACRLSL